MMTKHFPLRLSSLLILMPPFFADARPITRHMKYFGFLYPCSIDKTRLLVEVKYNYYLFWLSDVYILHSFVMQVFCPSKMNVITEYHNTWSFFNLILYSFYIIFEEGGAYRIAKNRFWNRMKYPTTLLF